MGYNDENVTPMVVDIETTGREDAALAFETITAPSNYKDPALIETYIADKKAALIGKAALDPNLCKIVSIGVTLFDQQPKPMVVLCRDEASERAGLAMFYDFLKAGGSFRPTISFNGKAFDLLAIQCRAAQLGLVHQAFELGKYNRYSKHIDLLMKLTGNGEAPYHSLKVFCWIYGVPWTEDAITGADIPRLVKENTDEAWQQIATHNQLDVLATFALAHRVKHLF